MLEQGLGIRYTALVDFQKLGYTRVVHLCIKAPKESKDKVEQHLMSHSSLNSLVRINHGYNFLAHMVFRDVGEMKQFVDDLQSRFGAETQVFEAIDELVRERFISKSGFS
jgi:DNA-binding Lrp family transcriptional regulator